MKYYLIEIAEGNTKVAGKAIYEYDTKDKALAMYHKKLGTAYDSDLYTSELVMVINETGFVERSEKWVRPITEVVEE